MTSLKTLKRKYCKEIEGIFLQNTTQVKKVKEALRITALSLQSCKVYVSQNTFASDKEEVDFYKNYKTFFKSKYLYFGELLILESSTGLLTLEKRSEVFKEKTHTILAHHKKNYEYYIYVQTEESEEDLEYFTQPEPEGLFVDEEGDEIKELEDHICSHENLFARVMANIQLCEYMNQKQEQSFFVPSDNEKDRSLEEAEDTELAWTGTSLEMAEISRALQAVGCFNNGRATVKEIISYLGRVFNKPVEMDRNIYREFRDRKEQTAFLDKLKVSYIKKFFNKDTSMN